MKNILKLQLPFIFLLFTFSCHGAFAGINEISDLDTDYLNRGKQLEGARSEDKKTGKSSAKKIKRKRLKLLKINDDAKRTRIQLKHGMAYKNINDFIFPDINNKFSSGFGRVTMFGQSSEKNCEADLFLNKNSLSLFAAIYFDNKKLTREFYLDHPYMKYSDILFQYVLTETNKSGKVSKAAIVVEGKNSAFKIVRDLNQIDFVFIEQDKVVEYCIFDLSLMQYHDGEQE